MSPVALACAIIGLMLIMMVASKGSKQSGYLVAPYINLMTPGALGNSNPYAMMECPSCSVPGANIDNLKTIYG